MEPASYFMKKIQELVEKYVIGFLNRNLLEQTVTAVLVIIAATVTFKLLKYVVIPLLVGLLHLSVIVLWAVIVIAAFVAVAYITYRALDAIGKKLDQ